MPDELAAGAAPLRRQTGLKPSAKAATAAIVRF